jgi:hypothetical protein
MRVSAPEYDAAELGLELFSAALMVSVVEEQKAR